jgi:hypothetical protein
MNPATLQMEASQFGLVRRAAKYEDQAALKLIESVATSPESQVAPPPHAPPVEPVSASPRDGSSLHVIA